MTAREGCSAAIVVVLAALVAGCTSANWPKIPLLPTATEDTAAPGAHSSLPHETSVVVPGTPTGVFTQVAHGALGCWFGAGGPLKASHVYRAEAEPPAKGGAAEIVIHERDVSLRDQRGTRAYRISFDGEATSVRVTATALKFEQKLAEAMERDVGTWAKGGEGCHVRTLFPPPARPVSAKPATKAVKGAGPSTKR